MKSIAGAILVAMKELGYLQKDKTVGGDGNEYKALSDNKATQAIRSALINAGIVALPIAVKVTENTTVTTYESVNSYKKPVMKLQVFCEVHMTYMLVHAESGESVTVEAIGHGVDNGDKSAGKAMTYAKKNALLNSLLISSGLDADDVHSDDLPEQPAPEQPAPPTIEEELAKFGGKYSTMAKAYAQALGKQFATPATAEEAKQLAESLYKEYYF